MTAVKFYANIFTVANKKEVKYVITFINAKAFSEFILKEFKDNLSEASRKMGISKSTLCLLKKGKRDIGKNTLYKLKSYCISNKIDINKLLFF